MGNFPLFLFLIMNLRIFYAKKFAGICKNKVDIFLICFSRLVFK